MIALNTDLEAAGAEPHEVRSGETEAVCCNLCGSEAREPVLVGKDRSFHTAGRWPVVRCTVCGLVYTSPRPNRAALTDHYETHYMKPGGSRLLGLVERLKGIQYGLTRRVPGTPAGRLLDVGCGNGRFLVLQRERGYEVEGVDLDAGACEVLEALEIPVTCGELSDGRWPDEHFDVVTFWHSLEHDLDPRATLEHAHRILKPGGTLLVDVPNFASFERSLFANDWSYLALPRHLYHFTPDTLKRMLEATGFEIERSSQPFLCPQLWAGSLWNSLEANAGENIKLARKTLGSLLLFPLTLPINALCSLARRGSVMVFQGRKV